MEYKETIVVIQWDKKLLQFTVPHFVKSVFSAFEYH